jgi:hypothetical protein
MIISIKKIGFFVLNEKYIGIEKNKIFTMGIGNITKIIYDKVLPCIILVISNSLKS